MSIMDGIIGALIVGSKWKDYSPGIYDGVDLTQKFADEIGSTDPWTWMKQRIDAWNFSGIHLNDYIPTVCANGEIIEPEIVGVDTYYQQGPDVTPHHVDFVMRDCWPDTVQWNLANYNNGIGCDKFPAGQTVYQLTHRTKDAYPAALTSVTVDGTATTDYTYDAATGVLTLAVAASGEVKANWDPGIYACPLIASNLYAYLNSEKCGVPNEEAADPTLLEVDYTQGGIYYQLPAALKAAIAPKSVYLPTRYTANQLRTSADNYKDVSMGPLWVLDEMEEYGTPMYSTGTYEKWFGRPYPGLAGRSRLKRSGRTGSRCDWRLASPYSGNSTAACYVNNGGNASNLVASYSLRAAAGFRIAKS